MWPYESCSGAQGRVVLDLRGDGLRERDGPWAAVDRCPEESLPIQEDRPHNQSARNRRQSRGAEYEPSHSQCCVPGVGPRLRVRAAACRTRGSGAHHPIIRKDGSGRGFRHCRVQRHHTAQGGRAPTGRRGRPCRPGHRGRQHPRVRRYGWAQAEVHGHQHGLAGRHHRRGGRHPRAGRRPGGDPRCVGLGVGVGVGVGAGAPKEPVDLEGLEVRERPDERRHGVHVDAERLVALDRQALDVRRYRGHVTRLQSRDDDVDDGRHGGCVAPQRPMAETGEEERRHPGARAQRNGHWCRRGDEGTRGQRDVGEAGARRDVDGTELT
mmetsp:Transcript_4212/g.7375  ORF Transcript_4212/g.7375 Transcript_4212/m.7375 type:complete len:324 (+) Transcript_4212:891-1862(+)